MNLKNPLSGSLITIKAEGRDAWENAGTDGHNPYDLDTWQREAWQEGYDYAKKIEMED